MAGPFRKPEADVFTVMLIIALVAIIVGSVFLFLETKDYDQNKRSGRPSVAQASPPAGGESQIEPGPRLAGPSSSSHRLPLASRPLAFAEASPASVIG